MWTEVFFGCLEGVSPDWINFLASVKFWPPSVTQFWGLFSQKIDFFGTRNALLGSSGGLLGYMGDPQGDLRPGTPILVDFFTEISKKWVLDSKSLRISFYVEPPRHTLDASRMR